MKVGIHDMEKIKKVQKEILSKIPNVIFGQGSNLSSF